MQVLRFLLLQMMLTMVTFSSSTVSAEILRVPTDYDTIQLAIDAASATDIIDVDAGTYFEQIDSKGKAITVRGEVALSGEPATIIDAENSARVLTVDSGEQLTTVFRNLVFQNGNTSQDGGGAFVGYTSKATFVNCFFLNNTAARGGGAFVWQRANFTGCQFIGNHSSWSFPFNGSALVRGDGSGWPVTMDGCTVTGNTAADPTSWAVYSYMPKNMLVINSTICGNDSYECNSCSGSSNYVNDECPVACEPTSYTLSVNSNSEVTNRGNRCACEKEWGSCGSYHGEWAVAYDLSEGVTAGREVIISCITYASWNDAENTNGTIKLWKDSDGGAPTHPYDDLELLGSSDINIMSNAGLHVANFEPPLVIAPDTNLVVTMYASWAVNGYLSVGGNSSPSSSKTWYRDDQGFCSGDFTELANLGFPNFNWVTELSLELGDIPCPGDINGDGIVDGTDLSLVLGYWGRCSTEDCPPDLNNDGVVDGADLSVLLGGWGSCS